MEDGRVSHQRRPGRVKDVLDIFVRTGMNKSSELVPQLELLKKISDTLGVLGLGELRGDIDGEIDRLKAVVERGGVANDQVILEIASTLLRVEDRLDQQLMRSLTDCRLTGSDAEMAPEDDAEFSKVAESVMRECIINLARIKETDQPEHCVAGAVAGTRQRSVADSRHQGRSADARTRRARWKSWNGSAAWLRMLKAGGPHRLTQKETDRLADAIVSIEYYMETVKAGRSEPWYMLDNAEACLAVLRDVEERLRETASEPDPAPDAKMRHSIRGIEERARRGARTARMRRCRQPRSCLCRSCPGCRALDPELLEIFIEEAKQEIASIKRHFRLGRIAGRHGAAHHGAALVPYAQGQRPHGRRRAHWRVLLGGRRPAESPDQSHAATYTADGRFHSAGGGRACRNSLSSSRLEPSRHADISLLIARANAFADGDPNAAVLTIEPPASESRSKTSRALEMDPVLLRYFLQGDGRAPARSSRTILRLAKGTSHRLMSPTNCIAPAIRCMAARTWRMWSAALPLRPP